MSSLGPGLKLQRFHDLAPFSVREVLLVASPYDAFILEEDALLTEQVFNEYRDLSLPASPRFTHVATGEEAMRKLEVRRYDLILTVTRLVDMSVNDFGRRVKALRPNRPVVLLVLDPQEIQRARQTLDPESIDAVFLWNGDARILLAVLKYVEDRQNIDHDIATGNVRVIIMIEDSPRYYSSFLAMLYHELMKHARSLYQEGVNELHRRMYMNSRPKILHATSYEEGVELFERYRQNVLAIISDADILRGSRSDGEAGVDLVEMAHRVDPELPLLLQSSDQRVAERAARLGATFVNKSSPHLLEEINRFLSTSLGFGDFIFRHPDGHELDRAKNLLDLEKKLEEVPEESVLHHAGHNHFSMWLMARSEFEVAEMLRPKKLSDFDNVGSKIRAYLVSVVHEVQRSALMGAVPDFSKNHFDYDLMIRLGDGPLGGKARGLAFFYRRLAALGDDAFSPELPVCFPKSVFITTDYFDEFLDRNDLRTFAVGSDDEREIARRFRSARLPAKVQRALEFLVEMWDGPIAVRSSSLLEDSLHQPFAGIYNTLMIANNDPEPKRRHEELVDAVKLVYASTFSRNAKSYLRSTGKLVGEEKMGVIVQQLVGRPYGSRFYPTFSGVAESYNFYPLGPQRPEEGVVHVALGLGRFVVDGGMALRFNPHRPGVMPPHQNVEALLNNTQGGFYALDLERPCCDLRADLLSTVHYFDLNTAETDGTLGAVGSVFNADDQRVRDDLSIPGPRLVTFNNILRHKAVPLADTLIRLLDLAQESWGGPVELEFAVDMGDWGRRRQRRKPALYVLQVRSFAAFTRNVEEVSLHFSYDSLCASHRSLGHGVVRDLYDVIYVRRDLWTAEANKGIAREIARLNEVLGEEKRGYVLIGPGRWGSADEWLGIPVEWSQISNVKVIVEASPQGYEVEPSQGTHFFQNITSLQIGYLTLPTGADKADLKQKDYLDWEWLDAQTAYRETEHLRLLRFDEPLMALFDGREGYGVVAKPGAMEKRVRARDES